MDSSKFNVFRACISFFHVDASVAQAERAWIEEKSELLKFTAEQKAILLKEVDQPAQFQDILPLITKPADRAFLVDQIRILSRVDGSLSPLEKQTIEKIKEKVLSKVDMNKLETIIAKDEEASYHEDEVYQVYNKHSIFESLTKKILKVLNPGDYKFPDKE